MLEILVSEEWRQRYPGASVGVLAMGDVTNPATSQDLEIEKKAMESALRVKYAGFDRQALKEQPILAAFHSYYRQFKKTYHVLLQLESVIHKGKSIPSVAALVEAMFIAELKNHLLTAGHDRNKLAGPVRIGVADGSERYVRINGQDQLMKEGDMYIADDDGIISSIIYGPDNRTRITRETSEVIFTTYAPPGIDSAAVSAHLADIESNIRRFTPAAVTHLSSVYEAG